LTFVAPGRHHGGTMPETDVDVLVIGAGPTGLALAFELRRHGLRCRLVDQGEGPSLWSKAQAIHARTLELLERAGIVDELLEDGKRIQQVAVYAAEGRRIAHFQIEGLDTAYPYIYSLPQRDTEIVLARCLERAGVAVEHQLRLERFTQDEHGVDAVLVHHDGREEVVRAAWLVGCDGAHSAVRHGLALLFEGSTYEVRIIQADVHVSLPMPVEDDEALVFLGEGALVGLLPLPGEHRYRMLVPRPPGDETEATLENFKAIFAKVGPPGAVVDDPAWMIAFRLHCRMVDRYRVGRVFLAGDAAHIHSPAGGQGMNMGIQDAFNLAWKLALCQQGLGQPVLLDSYHAERHPVAAATLAGTDTATSGLAVNLGLHNKLALELRNQIVGFATGLGLLRRKLARAASMLDVHYAKSPIVAQDRPSPLGVRVLGNDEAPTVTDWFHFGHGPRPGDRAPDVRLDDERDDSPRLFAAFDPRLHTLLLFDGATASEAGYQSFLAVAERLEARWPGLVAVRIVVPHDERPAALAEWDGQVVFDATGAVHERYGARSECLYLVRPDGYVGYRCQPAEPDKLVAYLERIFV
jgi:2-polyprenyl-6-methoxyphenol hydroxylase-like FAD-dependent oxidoreductase